MRAHFSRALGNRRGYRCSRRMLTIQRHCIQVDSFFEQDHLMTVSSITISHIVLDRCAADPNRVKCDIHYTRFDEW